MVMGFVMLEVKNILEDIVMRVIEENDEYKLGNISWSQKIEAASYILNRMTPMYITSNRGFSNLVAKYENDPQFLADVMIKVEEAVRLVKKNSEVKPDIEDLDRQVPYYLLPKVYGKLISSKTLLPLNGVKVSFYVDNKLAKLVFQDWKNPCRIDADDEGFFSFAPFPVKAEAPFEPKVFQLKLEVQRGDQKEENFVSYESSPSFIQNVDLDFNENVLQLEDIYVSF